MCRDTCILSNSGVLSAVLFGVPCYSACLSRNLFATQRCVGGSTKPCEHVGSPLALGRGGDPNEDNLTRTRAAREDMIAPSVLGFLALARCCSAVFFLPFARFCGQVFFRSSAGIGMYKSDNNTAITHQVSPNIQSRDLVFRVLWLG